MDSNDDTHSVDVFNLESLVLITGPCSTLPDHCQRRQLPPSLVYHPLVEATEGTEPLYIRNNLPLFETIEEPNIEAADDGPAAAVLRRRRQRQQHDSQKHRQANEECEDTSDAYYQHMHRKPEYVEKRVRTREIELYQYARWQEESGRTPRHSNSTAMEIPSSSVVGTPPAGTTPAAAAAAAEHDESSLINETLRELEDGTHTGGTQKRQKIGMRKELVALLDSAGFQEARVRSGRASPAVGCQPPSSTRSGSPQPVADETVVGGGVEAVEGARLTKGERRLAHSAAAVVEQLLLMAAKLPDADPPTHRLAASSPPMSQSDSDSGQEMDDGVVSDGESEEIMPCDFSLPHKLYAGMMKQRPLK